MIRLLFFFLHHYEHATRHLGFPHRLQNPAHFMKPVTAPADQFQKEEKVNKNLLCRVVNKLDLYASATTLTVPTPVRDLVI